MIGARALPPRARLALLLTALLAPGAGAGELTAREIMERVDARDDGDNQAQDMKMILIDRGGDERVRSIRYFRRDDGEDTHSILFFLSPADVKDTGLLTYDYDEGDKDDDQWLYLPALKKVKRIAAGDKSGSFMGSDFSYADLTRRNLDDYDFRLLGEEEVHGHAVWQIEAVPNNEREIEETGYSRGVLFVRQDNYVIVRGVYWVKQGTRLKYFDVVKLEHIDGIWVPTEMHMTTKKGDVPLHKTVIAADNVRFNQDLAGDLFTTRQLEKGP